MSKIKLSYSAASRFKTCPQKYYYSLDYKPVKNPSAFPFGSAVEEGVTALLTGANLTQAQARFKKFWSNEYASPKKPVFGNPNYFYYKSDWDVDLYSEAIRTLNLPELDDVALELLNEEVLAFVKDETQVSQKVLEAIWYACLIRGNLMLKAFSKEILPQVEAVVLIENQPAVQYRVSIKNQDGDELLGYIDYVLKFKDFDFPVITDCKTSSGIYTEHDIDTSDQLRTYREALKEHLGAEAACGYIVLGKKIKYTKACGECKTEYTPRHKKCSTCKIPLQKTPYSSCQLLITEYEEEVSKSVLDDYDNILNAIANEVTYRNPDNCTKFGRKCEFYDMCWNLKKPEEIDTLTKKRRRA